MKIKSLIVDFLEWLCGRLDRIPYFDFIDRRWHRNGCWGCRFNLALKSDQLDQRWGTGRWEQQ